MKEPVSPKTAADGKLLDQLFAVDDDTLEKRVQTTEGVNGSTVEPVYSTRKMKCYSVTESELRQIGLANLGVTAFSAIGSALTALSVDLFKDTQLSSNIPASTVDALSLVQPILVALSVGFWFLVGLTVWWRRNMIALIKEES